MNTEEKAKIRISLIEVGFTEEQAEITLKCIFDEDDD